MTNFGVSGGGYISQLLPPGAVNSSYAIVQTGAFLPSPLCGKAVGPRLSEGGSVTGKSIVGHMHEYAVFGIKPNYTTSIFMPGVYIHSRIISCG